MRMEDFGEWLKAELEKKHISRYDFAEKSGYDYTTVSIWINGKQIPRYSAFINVLDTLGYRIEVVPK